MLKFDTSVIMKSLEEACTRGYLRETDIFCQVSYQDRVEVILSERLRVTPKTGSYQEASEALAGFYKLLDRLPGQMRVSLLYDYLVGTLSEEERDRMREFAAVTTVAAAYRPRPQVAKWVKNEAAWRGRKVQDIQDEDVLKLIDVRGLAVAPLNETRVYCTYEYYDRRRQKLKPWRLVSNGVTYNPGENRLEVGSNGLRPWTTTLGQSPGMEAKFPDTVLYGLEMLSQIEKIALWGEEHEQFFYFPQGWVGVEKEPSKSELRKEYKTHPYRDGGLYWVPIEGLQAGAVQEVKAAALAWTRDLLGAKGMSGEKDPFMPRIFVVRNRRDHLVNSDDYARWSLI